MSNLLQKITKYFTEWDGEDKTAPKMELGVNDLRYIASMNVDLCREEVENRGLHRQLDKKDVELITMKHLLEKSAEEIENLYGKETELTEEIREFLSR